MRIPSWRGEVLNAGDQISSVINPLRRHGLTAATLMLRCGCRLDAVPEGSRIVLVEY